MSPPSTVLHAPHASAKVPDNIVKTFLLDEADLRQELLRMTDWHTDELFALPPETATTVTFPVNRLVVDPERFVDDTSEPMAQLGMGAVYTRTSSDKALRASLSAAAREKLLEDYYRPHHQVLAEAVAGAIDEHGRCLIVDAHSFASCPLSHEPDQTPDRPDICIGTDPLHTPPALAAKIVSAFEAKGFAVEVDRPFAGSIVPLEFYEQSSSVTSIMVEVNRSLYMDEATGAKLREFGEVLALLRTGLLAMKANGSRMR